VMFSHDPGGAMMAEMEMSPIERLFSLGIPPMKMEEDQQEDQDEDPSSHSGQGDGGQESGAHDGHSADDGARQTEEHEGSENSGQDSHKAQGHEGMQMDMQSMSMTTPLKRPAAVLAACSALLLTLMLLLNAEWPVTQAQPDPRSAHQVGGMLMSKYMMAFEGAGLLILIGIYGAVLLSRPGSHPDDSGRLGRAAIDDKPVPIAEPPLDPLLPREAYPDEEVGAGHGESH